MSESIVGRPAPSFRLPAAQGGEVGSDDYRGRQNLILYFAVGMACGFCRQSMSQLARGYPRYRELDAEILQVAPTKPERGRFYARNFQLPFPYLCDPEYRAYEAYGLKVRQRSLLERTMALYHGARTAAPPNDFGPAKPNLSELALLSRDEDMGFFVVDRSGVIRYARTGSYGLVENGRPVGVRPIPSHDEIIRELERCPRGG